MRNITSNLTIISPAKAMFGREIKRFRFQLLIPPNINQCIDKAKSAQVIYWSGKRDKVFVVGQNVSVRDYSDPNKKKW